MDQRLVVSLVYVVPGALAGGLALHAGLRLRGIYAGLRLKAAEAERPVPPLVTLYFRGSARVLLLTAGLFLAAATADLVSSFAASGEVLSLVLGYGGALSLLLCAFALLMQGAADRRLEFHSRRLRLAYTGAGVVGIAAAAFGFAMVTWHGGIWSL